MINFAIVICSSNARAQFLPVFKYYMRKHLVGSEFCRCYVIGCTREIKIPGIIDCKSNSSEQSPWSQRVLDGLAQVKEKNILLLTEDILFLPHSTGVTIHYVFNKFIADKLRYLRLDSFPRPKKDGHELYGNISKYSIYRVSLQPSFWRKDYLCSLMVANENIWQFELNGSRRSREDMGIMSLRTRLFPYSEVIAKGTISRKGALLVREMGHKIPIDIRQRSYLEESFINIKNIVISLADRALVNSKKFTGF